jgi:C-terminal peptidase prc
MHRSKLDRFDERIKGKLVGIGAHISSSGGELVVKEVFGDSPAEAGGLHREDRVLRVDGISTKGMSVRQAVSRIRGALHSEVRLLVERVPLAGEEAVLELFFTRAEVKIPNVSWSMDSTGIGTITIDHFSEQTVRLVREAIVELTSEEDEGFPLKGVVLDLRGNSGGSMVQSAGTADLFLSSGVIVKTLGKGGKPVPNLLRLIRAHPAAAAPLEPSVPVIILQNRRSASASEILAGSLAMLDRATVIGQTSFGKGTVQKLYVLRSGADKVRLKLTVAEYQLAEDIRVHGVGLEPDLDVRRAVFSRAGAWIPAILDDSVLLDVDIRQGWGDGPEPAKDPLHDLATQILRETEGRPSRQAGLDALERLRPQLEADADERVVSAFKRRDLDWSASDEQPEVLEAAVELRFKAPVRSGERVEVEAIVTNLGPAPLYRVRARLSTDSKKTPWGGVTIPIGFLPPQEQGIGSARIPIPIGQGPREDLVSVSLEADGLDPIAMQSTTVQVEGREAPPLSVIARLVPQDGQHMVQLELTNHGAETLTGVRARLLWKEDSGMELIDTEARLPVLAVGEPQRADLLLRVLDPEALSLPLAVRVEAEQFQEVLRVQVVVPLDGTDVSVAPPTVRIDAPVSAPSGSLRVGLVALDDSSIETMTVWWNGDKVAYGTTEESTLRLDLDLPLEVGSQRLTVVVRDDQGNTVRQHRAIRGVLSDAPGAADAE